VNGPSLDVSRGNIRFIAFGSPHDRSHAMTTCTARWAFIALFAALVSLACVVAVRDDAAGALSLCMLAPLVGPMVPAGHMVVDDAPRLMPACGAALAALLALAAWVDHLRDRREEGHALLVACSLAIAGEVSLIEGQRGGGIVLYGLAALVVLERSRRPEPAHVSDSAARSRADFELSDLGWLSAISLLAVFFRFYALNRVFDYFEGELSPYMAGATDLRGMLYANVGDSGPWAPLGYFYYLPIFVTTRLFGTTVLAVRLASAIVSVLTVPLLYGLLRRIAGREAAVIGAFFIAVDPLQIGWGRSDIHPHGSTVWPAILLCWAIVNAAETGGWRYFCFVALLMGLSSHQYPSGQVAVLIPIAFLAWNLLFRSDDHFHGLRAVGAVTIGLALWLFGFPLQYLLAYGHWKTYDVFTQYGIRTSWYGTEHLGRRDVLSAVASRAFANLEDLIAGLFLKVPYLMHQEFIPEYPTVPVRTVFWIAAASAFVVAVHVVRRPRDRYAVILLLWTLCGLLPSVFSDHGYAKRAAITYVAVYGLAAVCLATVHRALVARSPRRNPIPLLTVELAAVLLVTLASTYQWFSGDHYPYGEPREIGIARRIREHLEPGTIVIADFSDHYQRGMFTFLLIDAVVDPTRSPVAWIVADGAPISFDDAAQTPEKSVAAIDRTIWYKWTRLWYQLPPLQSAQHWSKAIFLFQSAGDDPRSEIVRQHVSMIRRRCPNGGDQVFDEPGSRYRFDIVECVLRD
jgi:hypothetical protein